MITTGVASASYHHPMHKQAPQKMLPPPKQPPVIYQIPQQTPVYSGCNENSPYITFSVGNLDVTLGL